MAPAPLNYTPPHVLVFAFPAQGHVNACMDMSRKLASLGVSITLVCTESYIATMPQQDFHAEGLHICLLGMPDGLPPEKSMTDTVDQVQVLVDATESMGPSVEALLMKLREENRVACILYDLCLWWMGHIGRKLNIPAYIFSPLSASFYSCVIHIPGYVSQGRLPLGSHTDFSDESNVFSIPGFAALHAREVRDIFWSPNPVCSFSYLLRLAKSWRDATGILFNTVYELEKEVIEDLRQQAPEMDIRAVGPIVPLSFLSGADEMHSAAVQGGGESRTRCLKWLDKQPPSSVLYMAFGTIACLSKDQLHELAMGVEASTQSFLWVVRIPDVYLHVASSSDQEIVHLGKEVDDKNMNMPCCMGADYLPKGFEERTKGRGMVLWELAPQREVLAHKAVGGFFTHCGWNSTMESLAKGVPMLCMPMLGDQGMNGKLIEDILQVGKVMRRREVDGMVSREEVETGIKELMQQNMDQSQKTGSLWRLRASEVQELACKAAFAGGSSYHDLHGFVQTLARMNSESL